MNDFRTFNDVNLTDVFKSHRDLLEKQKEENSEKHRKERNLKLKQKLEAQHKEYMNEDFGSNGGHPSLANSRGFQSAREHHVRSPDDPLYTLEDVLQQDTLNYLDKRGKQRSIKMTNYLGKKLIEEE